MHRFTSAYFTFSSFQFSFAIYVKITLLRHVCFDTIYLIYMYDSIRKIWRTSFVCVADLQPSIAKYSSFIQERLSTKYSYGRHDDVEKMQSQLREKSVNFETHERHKTFSSWKQYYGNFKTSWKQSPVWSCYFITIIFQKTCRGAIFSRIQILHQPAGKGVLPRSWCSVTLLRSYFPVVLSTYTWRLPHANILNYKPSAWNAENAQI